MVRNYIAKIALLAILRYAELKNSEFKIEEFIEGLGESDLNEFELFDKYPIVDVDQLVIALEKEIGSESAPFIRLGLHGIASKIGSFSFFLHNSPNFKDVLNKSAQFSHVITDLISNIAVEDLATHFKVSYHFSKKAQKFNENTKARIIDISFGALAELYKQVVFAQDEVIEFHSLYTRDISDQEISEILGYKFISGSDGDFVLVPQAMANADNPNFEANLPSNIIQDLSKHLEAQNVESLVLVITNILDLKPSSSLEDISKQLHTSKRTLQRRLKNQNINFTKLKQNAAYQRSIELLNAGKDSIEEIATKLGYSSMATFMHAFTGWHGMSPSAYLKNRNT